MIKNTNLKSMLNILNDFMSHTFLPERMKVAKCNKLLCNLYNKEKYIVHVKQALTKLWICIGKIAYNDKI